MSGFESMFGSNKTRFQPLFGGGDPGAADGFTPMGGGLGQESSAPFVDVEVLLQRARDEGAQAAREQLQAEMEELQAQVVLARDALDQVARLRQEQVRAAAQNVGDLVLSLARRVVGDSLALHPDALPSVLEHALSLLPDEDDLTIRVAPTDVERVRKILPPRRRDQVFGDANVAQGCLVEGRQVSIDSTLESALEGAATAVRSWVETHG